MYYCCFCIELIDCILKELKLKKIIFFIWKKECLIIFLVVEWGGGVMLLDGVCVWYNIMYYCLLWLYFVICKWWMFLFLLINNIYLKYENFFCCFILRKCV